MGKMALKKVWIDEDYSEGIAWYSRLWDIPESELMRRAAHGAGDERHPDGASADRRRQGAHAPQPAQEAGGRQDLRAFAQRRANLGQGSAPSPRYAIIAGRGNRPRKRGGERRV